MTNPDDPRKPHVSDDTLLFFRDAAGPGQPIEFFNDQLFEKFGSRPFGVPVHISGAIHSVPLVGPDHSATVLRQLGQANLAGQFAAEPAYIDGTFVATSKPVGHGGLGFVEVAPPDDLKPPEFPRPPGGLRRPVVALLDTGVRSHDRLPADTDPDDPFLIHADRQEPPWEPGPLTGTGTLPAHSEKMEEAGEEPEVPVYGHATFIAGLIRQGAPTARVLDIPVMNLNGKANEGKVCAALEWLLGYIGQGNPVDVVCMAFGRVPGDHTDKPLLDRMEVLLGELADLGVQLVASAGNDHQGSKIYPAAFETVTAVGAGFGHYHANFSNFGDWVDRYRDGFDVLSIMPEKFEFDFGQPPSKRWARWSGTSFAAANFAADIARPHVR